MRIAPLSTEALFSPRFFRWLLAWILAWLFAWLFVATPSLAAPSVPYSLTQGSENEIGCFGPCECPVFMRGPLKGTFLLTPMGSDGTFRRYDVTNVDWVVQAGRGDISITGRGEYRVGSASPPQQQMVLDLNVGGTSQHFDSGLVGGVDFPRINISVATHGFFCWDSVFVVRSVPGSASGVPPHGPGLQAEALPNPFRDQTQVSFELPVGGPVDVRIHDVTGRLVRTLSDGMWAGAGPHALMWDGGADDGTDTPAGIYFARLEAPEVQATLRLARVR